MHKYGFGQAHFRDLLERSSKKFILYFSKFYTNFYDYLECGWILRFKSI
jgi:hypothetical protein